MFLPIPDITLLLQALEEKALDSERLASMHRHNAHLLRQGTPPDVYDHKLATEQRLAIAHANCALRLRSLFTSIEDAGAIDVIPDKDEG